MKQSKNKKGIVAFKIDFEKVYDKVDWNFLRYMLIKFGFLHAILSVYFVDWC